MEKESYNLDDLLAEERKAAPELPTHLMENILADAAEVSAAIAPSQRSEVRTRHWLHRLLEPVGGYPALVGAACALTLGVFTGYSGTVSLDTVPVMGEYIANYSGDALDILGLDSVSNFDPLAEG